MRNWVLLPLFLAVVMAGCAAQPTSVRLRVVYDAAWSLSGLALEVSPPTGSVERASTPAVREVQLTLPDDWDGSSITVDVFGIRGVERWAHGAVRLTVEAGMEVTATVILARLPCGAWCEIGSTQCEGDGVVVCEQRDEDSCFEWSTAIDCGAAAPFCSLGVCRDSCVDECAPGETRCAGPGGMQRCGENDSDSCQDWLPVTGCAGEQTCSLGRCAGECTSECDEGAIRCQGGGVSRCGDLDFNGCREWGPIDACPGGQSCQGEQCRPIEECVDECTEAVCDGLTLTSCGNFDLDDCLEPSPGESCVPSDACFEGRCSPTGCTQVARVCDEAPDPVCVGSTRRTFGALGMCSAGVCTYVETDTDCPFGCEGDQCTGGCDGVMCSDSGNVCLSNTGTCMGDGMCVYPPDNGASCDDSDACTTSDTCSDGVCAGAPMECETPGAAVCVDETTLRTFSGGMCGAADGICRYTATNTECLSGGRCEGGTCVNACMGTCTPERLATGQSRALDIALNATHVYWTNLGGNEVMRASLDGSDRVTLATGRSGARDIALNATHVYWTNRNSGEVWRARLDGGVAETLATGQDGARGIALNATHVYWTSLDSDEVMRASLDGGGVPETLATEQDGASGIALNATHVYWTNLFGDEVMRASLDGGGVPETLATGQDGAADVALNATHMYWTNFDGDEVMRASLDGTEPMRLAIGQSGALDIALNATHVYWTNVDGDEVMRALLDGSGRETLATGQDGAAGIALNATHVYWTNFDGDEVMRLAHCACP